METAYKKGKDCITAEDWFNSGYRLSGENKKPDAIEAYRKAIELEPDYEDTYYNLGNALSDMGKNTEAIEAYRKAIELKPEALYYCSKRKTHNSLNQEQEALNCFNRAYELRQQGNLGNNLRKGDIIFLKNTLT